MRKYEREHYTLKAYKEEKYRLDVYNETTNTSYSKFSLNWEELYALAKIEVKKGNHCELYEMLYEFEF